MERQAILLDAEFQTLMQNQAMDETIRKRLQDRFINHNEKGGPD